jgi:hypothetical protein
MTKIRSLRKWFVSMLVMVILFGGVNFTIAEESSDSSKAKPKTKTPAKKSGETKKDSGKKSSGTRRSGGGGYGGSARSSRGSG